MSNWVSLFPGVAPKIRDAFDELRPMVSLPKIKGTWFYVDPQNGANTNSGKSQAKAVADLQTAYGLCTSGAGDGIILLSGGTTTAHTTSYFTTALDWTKYAITVYGVCAPVGMYQRARVANAATTGEDLAYLIDVQGDNNRFINMSLWNGGTDAAAVSSVKVTGNRNSFENVHIMTGNADAAAATHRSLEINAAEENYFYHCTIGTDTIDRGNNASCEVLFDGACYRNVFEGCKFLAWVSTGTAHGAIESADADTLGRDNYFEKCSFSVFATQQASTFIGTAPTAGRFYITDSWTSYAAWDSNASNNMVFVNMPTTAASAGGGIVTTN